MSAHIQRAQLLLHQSRYELAEQELRQALALEPDHPVAHALLALCLARQKKFADANREARSAIHLSPDSSFCHYALADVLQEQEKLKEANAAIDEAIRLDPEEADYFAAKAGIVYGMRRWADALAAAEKGLELDAEHVACTNLRAMALIQLGRKAEAGATIGTALARDPENAVTHANQGWALLQQGEHRRALEHFREALRLNPELEWAREGIVEALKARHFFYRIMLQYFFWMSRLGRGAQWGIIIGAYVLSRFLSGPLLWLYVAFALMTWLSPALFNLLLRLNRFGRLALSRDQIVASNWVGGCLLLGLAFLGVGLVTGRSLWVLAAIGCVGLTLAVAGTFRMRPGKRTVLAAYTIGLAVIGAAALALAFVGAEKAAEGLGGLYLIAVIGFQFLAIAMALRH